MPAEVAVGAVAEAEIGSPTMAVEEFFAEARLDDEAMPLMTPPSEVVEVGIESGGIGAWHNGKKITAMWCNSAVRNSYAAVTGMGWKRLSNANDSSWVALTMLASHAEQMNATSNVRVESDGEIHEIYVW